MQKIHGYIILGVNMGSNTSHSIKIQIWINNVLEVIEVQKKFTTFISARIYAEEYSQKSNHPKFKLKIYNHLGENVYTTEKEASPEPIVYYA